MLEKRTVIDCCEVRQDGSCGLKLQKQICDGDTVLTQEPHRAMFNTETLVEESLDAINVNLMTDLGFPALDDTQRAWIGKIIAASRHRRRASAG